MYSDSWLVCPNVYFDVNAGCSFQHNGQSGFPCDSQSHAWSSTRRGSAL